MRGLKGDIGRNGLDGRDGIPGEPGEILDRKRSLILKCLHGQKESMARTDGLERTENMAKMVAMVTKDLLAVMVSMAQREIKDRSELEA